MRYSSRWILIEAAADARRTPISRPDGSSITEVAASCQMGHSRRDVGTVRKVAQFNAEALANLELIRSYIHQFRGHSAQRRS